MLSVVPDLTAREGMQYSMSYRTRTTVGTVALAAALAASLAGTTVMAHRGADPTAAIAITSAAGSVTNPLTPDKAGAFTIKVMPTNFTFDPASIGLKTNKPGTGHYHVYADNFSAATPFKNYVTASGTDSVQVTSAELAKVGVKSGTHTLYVVLANNDHSLVTPIAAASTVISLGPSIHLMEMGSPSHPLMIPASGSVTLHVGIGGFKMAPALIGKASTPGAGHYHIYVDSFNSFKPFNNYVTAGAAPTVSVSAADLAKVGAGPGLHTLYVVLANNDHSLVSPLTGDSTTIDIAG